jgi:hypothetical protein
MADTASSIEEAGPLDSVFMVFQYGFMAFLAYIVFKLVTDKKPSSMAQAEAAGGSGSDDEDDKSK